MISLYFDEFIVYSRSCARHESGYVIMKKMIIGIVAVLTTFVSVSVFANASKGEFQECNHGNESARVEMQGKHCRYTVGCSCPGFAPKTNGKEWERDYCRNCSHKKLFH